MGETPASNVQIVRKALEGRGLVEELKNGTADFARIYDPEITLELDGFEMPGMATQFRGYDEIRHFWQQWLESWEDLTWEVECIEEKGDAVVAVLRQMHHGRQGIKVPVRYAQLLRFQGHLLTYCLVTYDIDRAFAEAGIER